MGRSSIDMVVHSKTKDLWQTYELQYILALYIYRLILLIERNFFLGGGAIKFGKDLASSTP